MNPKVSYFDLIAVTIREGSDVPGAKWTESIAPYIIGHFFECKRGIPSENGTFH